MNLYPGLVGSANTMSSDSIVYSVGFPGAFVPSFKVYVILYFGGSHRAVRVASLEFSVIILLTGSKTAPSPSKAQP